MFYDFTGKPSLFYTLLCVVKLRIMKCEHKNCTRDATSKNQQYHPDKWLCTYHANKVVKEGRRKRKYGNK